MLGIDISIPDPTQRFTAVRERKQDLRNETIIVDDLTRWENIKVNRKFARIARTELRKERLERKIDQCEIKISDLHDAVIQDLRNARTKYDEMIQQAEERQKVRVGEPVLA